MTTTAMKRVARSADDLGIIDASGDSLYELNKNLDSSNGRLGSVLTDGMLTADASGGENGYQERGLTYELKKAGKYGYNTADGYISFKVY